MMTHKHGPETAYDLRNLFGYTGKLIIYNLYFVYYNENFMIKSC